MERKTKDPVRNTNRELLDYFGIEVLKADFERLYQKHPKELKSPLEAQLFVEEVMANPWFALQDNPSGLPNHWLVFARITRWGLVILEVQKGEVRSAHPIKERDILLKAKRAEKEGGQLFILGVGGRPLTKSALASCGASLLDHVKIIIGYTD